MDRGLWQCGVQGRGDSCIENRIHKCHGNGQGGTGGDEEPARWQGGLAPTRPRAAGSFPNSGGGKGMFVSDFACLIQTSHVQGDLLAAKEKNN